MHNCSLVVDGGRWGATDFDLKGNKMIRSICLVIAACVCSVSHAGYVVLDDFSTLLNTPAENTNAGNDQENVLYVFNPGATLSAFIGPQTTSTSDTGTMLGGQRDATFSIVNSPAAGNNNSLALIGGGQLSISNADIIDAELTLVYDANGAGLNQSLLDTSNFQFDVASSDVSSFDLTVSVFKQNDATTASTYTTTVASPTGGATTFDLGYGNFSLAAGATTEFDFSNDLLGKVEVTVGGLAGYDITFEEFSFNNVPEPGTAIGIASIGIIGFMTRRRRRA